jgi:hypothetical protein
VHEGLEGQNRGTNGEKGTGHYYQYRGWGRGWAGPVAIP